jgi:hypothetical protein
MRANEDHQTLARLLKAHPELEGAVVPRDAHGTVRGYSFFGCRCDRCRKANADRSRERRERRRLRPDLIPEHLHGTLTGYLNWACRCDRCRAANTQHAQEVRSRS